MEFIVGILLYDSNSKFLELLLTFYFFFNFLFRTVFYFSELLYYFSFIYVLFLVSTRTSNPTAATIC